MRSALLKVVRARPALVAGSLVVGCAAFAWPAGAGVQIRRIDPSGYPLVRVLVVVPPGSTAPPSLSVQGAAAAGFTASNLAGKESIALVIDRSQAMRGVALGDAVRAASAFVAASPSSDRISLIGVGSRSTSLAGFAPGGNGIARALAGLSLDPYPGTTLWAAIVQAAESLRSHAAAGRVIVVLTAGRNSDPARTLADAIRAARMAQATVYTIGVPSRVLAAGHWLTLGHRWYTPKPLQQLAAATGGRFYPAPISAALPDIYRAIGAELRRTWQLSFATAARPGATLTLQVRDGGSHATSTARLPGNLTSPTAQGPNTFLVVAIAFVAALMLAGAVGFARSTDQYRRWSRRLAGD